MGRTSLLASRSSSSHSIPAPFSLKEDTRNTIEYSTLWLVLKIVNFLGKYFTTQRLESNRKKLSLRVKHLSASLSHRTFLTSELRDLLIVRTCNLPRMDLRKNHCVQPAQNLRARKQ